jgi:transcriptional regulator with XRE-family HTH domain
MAHPNQCKGRPRTQERTTYGQYLRNLRTESKLTQQQLAFDLGMIIGKTVHMSAIAYWETHGLSQRFVVAGLAKALNVSTDKLLRLSLPTTREALSIRYPEFYGSIYSPHPGRELPTEKLI